MTLATLRGFNVLRPSPEVAMNNVNVYAFKIAELKAAELAKRAVPSDKSQECERDTKSVSDPGSEQL